MIKFLRHAERGQAMAEYMALYPGAIMITIGLSLVVGFIVTSLHKTVDAFNPVGIVCEAQEDAPASREGPTVAMLGDHRIELTASVYNPSDDTTTITYRVTSADKPSISHWVLALPEFIAANIIETSEPHEAWGVDPTTGVAGIKFDTGYEVPGGGGGGSTPGGGKPGKGKSKLLVVPQAHTFVKEDPITTVSRDITLLVSGQYNWGPLETAVKAGTEVHYSTISAPTSYYDPSLNQGCN